MIRLTRLSAFTSLLAIGVGAVSMSAQVLDSAAYLQAAKAWDRAGVNARLGPTFETLNPGAVDKRPTLYKPASKERTGSYANRSSPYELGTPKKDSDYWSDSGQVAYVPDDPTTDPGLDRIQTFAYYDSVFATSPRLDWASISPHPDPQTKEVNYATMLGASPSQPIAMVRNYGMNMNEALVLYRDGLFAVAGTQTSRASWERPYPGFVFPKNKVPSGLAVTTANELALVTIWDTDTRKGQLAVIALEAKYIAVHTWKYIGLPNQGSWSNFKLLGYIDLPMTMPSAVSAATNGSWISPSQTSGYNMSGTDPAQDWARVQLYTGSWTSVVSSKGYAIVASKRENMAVIVDLAPLLNYFRESYLSSSASFSATVARSGAADSQFPEAFTVKPGVMPRIVYQMNVSAPSAVLAGIRIDRWSSDRLKGYIASEDGTVSIMDTSSLMTRYSWEPTGPLVKLGSFKVGRNPVSMALARHLIPNLPLIPKDSKGVQLKADPLNNTFWVACRGEREVQLAVTWGGSGAVHHRIQDSRMGDPVNVSVAQRGNILSVADFSGKKILSFRIGDINDTRNKVVYGCGPTGKDAFEFAGELLFNGFPFLVNSSNVN